MTWLKSRAVPTILGTALLCGLAASTAVAGPPDEAAQMSDFFKGTLEIETPAGQWSAKRYLQADHTYRETGSDGPVTGTWKIEAGKICATPSRPLGDDRAATYCNVGVGKKGGDAWRDEDPVTGNTVMFKLTPRR